MAGLETQITKLTDLIEKVDQALADPNVFKTKPELAGQLAKDRAGLAARLAKVEEEWLVLSSQ